MVIVLVAVDKKRPYQKTSMTYVSQGRVQIKGIWYMQYRLMDVEKYNEERLLIVINVPLGASAEEFIVQEWMK